MKKYQFTDAQIRVLRNCTILSIMPKESNFFLSLSECEQQQILHDNEISYKIRNKIDKGIKLLTLDDESLELLVRNIKIYKQCVENYLSKNEDDYLFKAQQFVLINELLTILK